MYQQSGFVYGFGSNISYGTLNATTGAIGTYLLIAQSIDINTPIPEVGDIKLTNNSSPTGGNPAGAHEYAPGMTEPGDVEWDVVYVKAKHEAVNALVGNGLLYSFQEAFPDGTIYTFPGYFKSAGIEGKTEDGALMGKMKAKAASPGAWT